MSKQQGGVRLTLYEKQYYCECRGYRIRAQPEEKQFRMQLFKNGELLKTAELVDARALPAAYAQKYTALYEYLIK